MNIRTVIVGEGLGLRYPSLPCLWRCFSVAVGWQRVRRDAVSARRVVCGGEPSHARLSLSRRRARGELREDGRRCVLGVGLGETGGIYGAGGRGRRGRGGGGGGGWGARTRTHRTHRHMRVRKHDFARACAHAQTHAHAHAHTYTCTLVHMHTR